MKPLLLAAAVAVAAAVTSLPQASATEPNGAGSAWSGYPPAVAGAVTRTPQYEWQYHYAGRHPRLQGHWVPVR